MTKEKIVFCWSGGKDSALALHYLLQDGRYEVVALLTTCSEHFQHVSMHGVRLELLDAQARAIGLPLEKIFVSQRSSNGEYEQKMGDCMRRYKDSGATAVGYGDIFLEDLKTWREQNLAKIGLRDVFPIWKVDSNKLMKQFIELGFGSVVCCVNDAYLDERWLGRKLDWDFVQSLPRDVDPCGENGEFHSFAFQGPIFKKPVRFEIGEKVYRPVEQTHPSPANAAPCASSPRQAKGFWFCDLLPEKELK
jgi:uncharacterized protein (TIGR00290 family)